MKKKHKSFTIISQSLACNADCPYCTAKITRWPSGDDQWEKISEELELLHQHGHSFEYCTISGNGEPALVPKRQMYTMIEQIMMKKELFGSIRIQTNGILYSEEELCRILSENDMVVELSRVSVDEFKNSQMLASPTYLQLDNFRSLPAIINVILLKENICELESSIDYYSRLANVQAINLRVLNPNTLDEGNLNNPYSQWILENGITKNEVEPIIAWLEREYCRSLEYDSYKDRLVYKSKNGKDLTISPRSPLRLRF